MPERCECGGELRVMPSPPLRGWNGKPLVKCAAPNCGRIYVDRGAPMRQDT